MGFRIRERERERESSYQRGMYPSALMFKFCVLSIFRTKTLSEIIVMLARWLNSKRSGYESQGTFLDRDQSEGRTPKCVFVFQYFIIIIIIKIIIITIRLQNIIMVLFKIRLDVHYIIIC